LSICIVGDTEDLSSVYFGWAAGRAGLDVLTLDEERLGVDWSFGVVDGPETSGHVETGSRRVAFTDLVGVFARFTPEPGLPPGTELDADAAERLRAERRAGLHQLLDRVPCPVANRPSAGRANGSKPLQMAQLEAAGFRVPEWLVSNDAERVTAFMEREPSPPIYKAVSGLRSRVRLVDEQLLARLADGTSPVLVQRYVAGRDVRVHVAGPVCHPTEVRGEGIDYRFDGARSYRACEVPAPVAARCVRVADELGLHLAGFDFRVDADERWWCLEVNPMPSYIPYEWETGQPIAESVIEHFLAFAG
jgi:glutathione synthase/RimK-type ligase-like ATP-grasp enzyme